MKKLVLALSLFALPVFSQETALQPLEVSFSHQNEKPGEMIPIKPVEGQPIRFVIRDTDVQCYSYNARAIAGNQPAGLADNSEFTIDAVHDEETTKYEIEIAKLPDAPETCKLPLGTWSFPVRTTWRLGVSGAYTFNGLTQREYFLEPGSRDDGNGNQTNGFFVRRLEDSEDAADEQPAVMLNVFSVSPRARGFVPLSLGLTLDDDRRILAGVGYRMGTTFFLTAGAAFGEVNRLPDGLRAGSFVTSDQALAAKAKRDDVSWFVSFSLPIFKADLPRLKSLVASGEDTTKKP